MPKSDTPFTAPNAEKKDDVVAPPSRFIDEKISDESGSPTAP
jgi:hypothetical protein